MKRMCLPGGLLMVLAISTGQKPAAAYVVPLAGAPVSRTRLSLVSVALSGVGSPQQAPPANLAPPPTLQQIAALLARDDLAGAKAAIAAALADHPADPALHNLAGVTDAQSGSFASAEAHFQTAIRLAPRENAPYENLGRLYQERAADDPAARSKALDIYRRLLAVHPSNAEGLYQAGFLLALGGQFADSRALFDLLPENVRRRPQSLAVAAIDLAGLGNARAAAATVQDLAAHSELSAPDVLAVMPAFEHLPDDDVPRQMLEGLDRRGLASADALQRLGEIHTRHQRYREAAEVLERAAASAESSAPILVDLARATDKLGNHEKALGYLAHARDLEPQNATVHFLFGIVCVELNLGSEAYESLKKAVALTPENALVNYAMGAVSMHRHEPAESLPYFEKYIELAPADPRGRFALGVARYYSSQLDAAGADLRKAAEHTETAAGAHYFLGRIARQSNDLETARKEIDASLRRQPQYAEAWAELGLIQTREGSYAEAERSLDRAVKIDPDNYSAAVNLATLYGRTKDPRREAQGARLAALQEKRDVQAQEFLRIIEVVR
jgi:tetratricopeptide (TPR) repeat protein